MSRQALSKGEMEVARVLWEIAPATVREVYDKLPVDRAMTFATVQTYLRRLESKGYATSKLKGRVRTYAARAKPGTVIRDAVGELVDRLFGGQSLPLVRHLIEQRALDAGELAEIRKLIEIMEKPESK